MTVERGGPDGRLVMTCGALDHDPRRHGAEDLLVGHHSPWTDPRTGQPRGGGWQPPPRGVLKKPPPPPHT
ncbi:hypothetical protein, partial [Frankia nepalensis]|uniref:hypothetical protein n=1 Tax=Frankia nepalensis TaxID=1836974 RepID=UPI001EE47BA0